MSDATEPAALDATEGLRAERTPGPDATEQLDQPAQADSIFCEQLAGVTLSDRYRIDRLLGSGGMGEVYLAEQTTIKKQVAIKVLNIKYATSTDVVGRFLREAQAASLIDHENVVTIMDFGKTPAGSVYFAMERLKGEDLGDTLTREGALPWARVKPMALQICRALEAAHAHNIVHRDMKPSNCFRTTSGDNTDFIKVVDFGIAKQLDATETGTQTGTILGTPAYMSPEQVRALPIDNRSDVYSLGVILYQLLTGKLPFERANFTGVLTAHLFDLPPAMREVNPEVPVPAAVEAVVRKAMEKKPEDRYGSVTEMAAAMNAVDTMAAAQAIQLPDAGASSQALAGAGTGGSSAKWIGLGLASVAVMGLVFFLARRGPETPDPPPGLPSQNSTVQAAVAAKDSPETAPEPAGHGPTDPEASGEPLEADSPETDSPEADSPEADPPEAVLERVDQGAGALAKPVPAVLSSGKFRKAMKRLDKAAKKCGANNGAFSGQKVKVSVAVAPNGKATAQAKDTFGSARVSKCVVKLVENKRFEKTKGGGAFEFSFTM